MMTGKCGLSILESPNKLNTLPRQRNSSVRFEEDDGLIRCEACVYRRRKYSNGVKGIYSWWGGGGGGGGGEGEGEGEFMIL